jgi:hypothetical protein
VTAEWCGTREWNGAEASTERSQKKKGLNGTDAAVRRGYVASIARRARIPRIFLRSCAISLKQIKIRGYGQYQSGRSTRSPSLQKEFVELPIALICFASQCANTLLNIECFVRGQSISM